ncbi:hypothetical protein H1R20_g9333, partial [Candolleomyces eurysporus]
MTGASTGPNLIPSVIPGSMDGRFDHSAYPLCHPDEEALFQAQSEKAGYLQHLSDIWERMKGLKLEEEEILREVTRCDEILAPVRRVPDDILREIFKRTLPSPQWLVTIRSTQSPTVLTQVCRRWRAVAIHYADLWKHLRIRKSMMKTASGVPRLLEIARRSKTDPFHLQVEWPKNPNMPASTWVTLMAPISRSLTSLSLHGVHQSRIAELPSNLFPCLQRLSISQLRGWVEIEGMPPTLEAFKDCPSLRRVALDEWFIDIDDIKLLLPWNQLTHFLQCDESHNFTFIEKYLASCTELRYLGLTLDDPDFNPMFAAQWDGRPAVHLPNFEGLFLKFGCTLDGYIHYPEFLDILDFPNLKYLRLEGDDMDTSREAGVPVWEGEDVARLAARLDDFPHLVHLAFSWDTIDYPTLATLLSSATGLETLDIRLGDSGRAFFNALRIVRSDNDEPWLLPQLRKLILRPMAYKKRYRRWITHDIHEESFERFVDARKKSSKNALKEVLIYSVAGLRGLIRLSTSFEGLPLLKECVDGGLELRVEEYAHGVSVTSAWMDDDPCLCDWPELQANF